MVVITAEACKNAQVHTIKVKHRDFSGIQMKDVQGRLGIKNIRYLLRKEMCGRFNSTELTEKQKTKYIRSEYQITKDLKDSDLYKYAKIEIIDKIIKNCRSVKKCNDGLSRSDKEDQRQNFRNFLGDLKTMKYMKEKNIQL